MKQTIRNLALLLSAAFCITAHAQIDLLRNSEFDSDLSYWANPFDRPAQWNATDSDGNGNSGSVQLTNEGESNGGVPVAIEQCIPALANTQYEFGGDLEVPSNQPAETRAFVFVYAYNNGDCSGSFSASHEASADGVGSWTRVTNVFFTGDTTTSLKVLIGVRKPSGETADAAALFDGLFVRQIGGQTGDVLGPAMSTSWYNPAESGHGVMIHILDATSAWMCWFTFDLDGAPTWICGLGAVSGNTIQFDDAFLVEGGAFPPDFDPDLISEVPWGSITITFTDCANGTLTWTTSASGFQSGSMPVARLLPLWGAHCP